MTAAGERLPGGTVQVAAPRDAGTYLPSPPTDRERDLYLGPERRWVFVLALVAFALVCISLSLFTLSRVWLWPFALPLGLYVLTAVVSSLTSLRRSSTTGEDHRTRVDAWRPSRRASVDVLLPSAGEPLEVLRNTYEHVARIDWDGPVSVHVLDDSARQQVRELAESFGFRYATRPDRGHLKKAGNLRFGYEHSSADVIAVLDADFAPRPDYLHELMPYLDDPEVGIVQSPQFFDTDADLPWLQRDAGATQEVFYRWIQPSRDRFAAAICVGTCALYRRAALDEAGGFAQISHSEDVHTGVGMMRHGYRVRYVPTIVAKGICPDTFSAFVNQQYRWCTGSMSLLRTRSFHEAEAISGRQRLSFFAGFLYYISTAVNAVLAPVPPLVMLWLLTSDVHPRNTVWMLGVALLWVVVYPLVHAGRWRLSTLRVQYLYAWAHLVAIVHHLTGRTQGWVATGAADGATPIASSVRRAMLSHGIATQALVVLGLVRGAGLFGWSEMWAMGAMALVNAFVVLPALWVAAEPPTR